jgi:hypothetical protein
MGEANKFGPQVLIDILHGVSDMCAEFDDFPEYLEQDDFEAAVKDLISASISDYSTLPFSFCAEQAFKKKREEDDEYYDEYCYDEGKRPPKNVFYQLLLKTMLCAYPGASSVDPVLKHFVPYYKEMASYYLNEADAIRGEEKPPYEWEERTKKERIDEALDTVKAVVEEANSYLQLLVPDFPQGTSCLAGNGKPLLHAILELGSDADGIAKNVVLSQPSAASIEYEGSCPLHVAVKSGCNFNTVEDLIVAVPDTISRREHASSLLPFQMAACSENASLDTIFTLLRKEPSLLNTETS